MTRTNLSTCIAAISILGFTAALGAQRPGLEDIYRQAESAANQAAAANPANAGYYKGLAALSGCQASELSGARPFSSAAGCGAAIPGLPGPVAGIAKALLGGGGVTGGASAGAGLVKSLIGSPENLMQTVGMIKTLGSIFGGFRKKKQVDQQSQPVRLIAPRADFEARQLQQTAQVLARHRAEIERAIDLYFENTDKYSNSVDAYFAALDATTGQTSAAQSSTATRPLTPAQSGQPSVAGNGVVTATSQPSSNTRPASGTSGANGGDSSRSTSGGSSSTASVRAASSCPGGWFEVDFLIDELGNDDLWTNTGALAFLTDDSGLATTLGRFLSIEYSVARKTPLHLAMNGGPSIAIAPGDVRRFAASPASNGTVTLHVRYCKE